MTLNELLHHHAEAHGVTVAAIRQRHPRDAKHAACRVGCYRALRACGWSYPRIARVFNRHEDSVRQMLLRHAAWRTPWTGRAA